MNKYRAKKTVVDGITFPSKKEANRYCELKLLEKAGKISALEMQKTFELIPTQREFLGVDEKGRAITGKVLERAVKYKADFCYVDHEKKAYIVEDTKGVKTKEYIIKRKLMLRVFGIRIQEI